MVHKCAVGGCPNTSDTVIHYLLPEEPLRRQRWLRFVRRSNAGREAAEGSRVCGRHFSADSFTKLKMASGTRLILHVHAVPTVLRPQDPVEAEHAAGSGPSEESDADVHGTFSLDCVKEEPVEYQLSPESADALRPNSVKVKLEEPGPAAEKLEMGTETDEGQMKTEPANELVYQDDKKQFHSSHCGDSLRNKGVLKQHIVGVPYSKHKAYHCNQCGKDFALKAFLKAHQKIHADVETLMSFVCAQCGRKFPKQSSLRKHELNHLVEAKFPCPVCSEEFDAKAALHNHVTKHIGHRLTCRFCDQNFHKSDSYIKHLDKHTMITPYYCEVCKVYQLSENGFLCHQRIHTKKPRGRGRRSRASHAAGQAKAEDLPPGLEFVMPLECEPVEEEKDGVVDWDEAL
ncbi:zinc finger protein 16 [Denticeps clupeoides]|uniref:Uncharacterized protein n=1 Tax=Denticeps clupeoides TaxID=299321 RepID=A0AAY4F085_9TELE|nr:zinc finger protein 16-like [Denticeps clupeoides]